MADAAAVRDPVAKVTCRIRRGPGRLSRGGPGSHPNGESPLMGTPELITMMVLFGGSFTLAVYLIGLVAYHAYRRGYHPVVWSLTAIIALNPIFLLVLLATVPHRRRLRLRAEFAAELEAKVA